VLVDIRPSARVEHVNHSRARLELDPLRSVAELEERFGISYLAPRDARATRLPDGSVDFVSSTDVCEHVPEDDLAAIFRECFRLLRPGGAFSCRIDLQDHYSYFDRGLSRYNFLRFSDRTWALVNSPIHFQNRLRAPEYLALVRDAGFELVVDNPSGPSEQGRAELQELPLAERFRGYSVEDLGVTILSFVSRAPADAEQ
jgi:SAM-dependent methyltransferase